MPDIIVTDYRLPDGRTAKDVLRAVWREYEIALPAIVLTGEVAIFEPESWMHFPVRMHRKPIAPETLLEEINSLCCPESRSQA
jgi:CheY-like chemotaxis protein